eukprot:TRINITY_DN29727_c0_g1_i1.p1 TRINITY_DN29727_c0_g1~~TRINITY_DN29727_c0_g1_i1.p1  ORF type:complete len:331 (+),score=80.99 TRINITY_DN29727_c0_g1_i1:103-993(+)
MDTEKGDTHVRPVECSLGILARADGSVSYKQGNTHVLVGIFGPSNVVPFLEEPLDAAILVSFQTPTTSGRDEFLRPTVHLRSDGMDSSSRSSSSPPQGTDGEGDGLGSYGSSGSGEGVVFLDSFVSASEWNADVDAKEMEFLLQDVLKSVVQTKELPRTAIHINIFILHHDGCLRSAVFNAVNLALLDAAIPSTEMIGAVEVYTLDGTGGHSVEKTVIVDPTKHVEDDLIQKNESSGMLWVVGEKGITYCAITRSGSLNGAAAVMESREQAARQITEYFMFCRKALSRKHGFVDEE